MAILMDDQCVAQRILDHIEQGTTDLGQSIWREPVDKRTNPDHVLFRRSLRM
jgi:hypothetical protein